MGKQLEETSTETETTEELETSEASETEGTSDSAGDAEGDAAADSAVEIDGIKFKNEKDALEWALENRQQLANERAVAEAYRTGIQDSLAQHAPANAKPIPKPDDITEEEFYQNPIEALKKVKKAAKDEARAEIDARDFQSKADRQVWEEFSVLHPDLSDFKTDVELIANSAEHLPILQALVRTKGPKAGYDYVAQKTRAKFQAYNDAVKTKTVLARGSGATPSPAGGARNVTSQPKQEKTMSMREQLNQHRSRFNK